MRVGIVLLATAVAMGGKDFYATLCINALSSAKTVCEGKKNYECFCATESYRASLAHCIATASNGTAYAGSVSWNAFRQQCKRVNLVDMVPSTFSEQLAIEPDQKISAETVDEMHIVANAYFCETSAADVYGIVLMCYVLGVILLVIIQNAVSWLKPQLVWKVANSRIGRFWRHYATFPMVRSSGRWLGLASVPTPLNCVVLVGYVMLSAVLMGINHPTADLVSPLMFPSTKVALIWGLGRRASSFALYNAPLVFLFGGRNNMLTALSGAGHAYFNMWHRWLARVMVAELIVHAVVHTKWALLFNALAKFWTFPYYRWGFASIMSMGLMVILSLPVFRRLSFDTFKLVHMVLAVVVMVGAWYHVAGHWIGRDHLLACIGIWATEHAINLVRIGALVSRPWGSKVGVVAHDSDEVVEVTVDARDCSLPLQGYGEFVYVHFLTGRYFWQAHPFTVVHVPERQDRGDANGAEFKLVFKARTGVTRRLFEKYKGSFTTMRVWLAGPYYAGNFTMAHYTEVVFIAGGIGITAVYAQLCRLATTKSKALASVDWYVKPQSTLEWFDKPLRHMGALADFTLHDFESSFGSASVESTEKFASTDIDEPQYSGNKQAYALVLDRIRAATGPMLVFVCGPERMHAAVQDAVKRGIHLTNHYVNLEEERFAP